MRVLVIGGNSYIAKAFAASCANKFSLTIIQRGANLREYSELTADAFRGVDTVINFAAIVHRPDSDQHMMERVNTRLPVYLATLAKTAGVSQFIQMSSIAVYGSRTYIDADTHPEPDTAYGTSKLDADREVQKLEDAGFAVAIVRPPVVYGPGAPGNMAMLIKLIRSGMPLPFAYRRNRRSILFIGNLTTALTRIIERRASGMFLLRDRVMPSLAEIAEGIRNAFGVKTLYFPLPAWFIKMFRDRTAARASKLYGDLVIDDGKSVDILGAYAVTSFDDAMRMTAQGDG